MDIPTGKCFWAAKKNHAGQSKGIKQSRSAHLMALLHQVVTMMVEEYWEEKVEVGEEHWELEVVEEDWVIGRIAVNT